MSHQQPDYEARLGYEIELALQRIALTPDDVSLHRALRATSLRYKAAGGPEAGLLRRVMLPPRDPVQRLLHVERVWAMDPADLDLVRKVLAALAAVERADPSRDCAAVRRFLYGIVSGMSGY